MVTASEIRGRNQAAFTMLAILTASSAIWLGCSHAYMVTFTDDGAKGDTVAAATVNRRLAERSATIYTREGGVLPVSGLHLSPDSCLFINDASGGALPTSDILMIRQVDHFSGAIGGFGIGIVTGFVAGFALGELVYAIDHHKQSRGAGIVPLVLAPLIGLISGASIGTRTVYELPPPVPDSTSIQPKKLDFHSESHAVPQTRDHGSHP